MGRPELTEDQREIAVTLLANAIRKDAHLRDRARQARDRDNPLAPVMTDRRADSSQRYVEGMCDLLKVLFVDGHAAVDACLEEAYAQAMGTSIQLGDNGKAYN